MMDTTADNLVGRETHGIRIPMNYRDPDKLKTDIRKPAQKSRGKNTVNSA